jgi:hypothetical protein
VNPVRRCEGLLMSVGDCQSCHMHMPSCRTRPCGPAASNDGMRWSVLSLVHRCSTPAGRKGTILGTALGTHHLPGTLQDSNFAIVSRYHNFLEVIDPQWMADSLSDDGACPPADTIMYMSLSHDGACCPRFHHTIHMSPVEELHAQ